jgi:membrane-associated protease RseP (regulator of RpoE activity)
MEMTWLASALVFLAGFWLVIFALNRRYNLKKRNIEVGPGILMWRTKRGLNFIDNTAKAHKSGWRTFGTAAVIVGFAFMVFMLVNLILNAALIITRPAVAPPGVRLVIPGLTIPLLEGLIAILSVLLVHEFAHGFVLRAQGLPTKSVGAMVFIAIPGAFVEPDEKRLKKAPVMQRLRVYGAGSFANILLALVCLSILLVAVVPRPGVYVWETAENTPAYGVLQPGMRLFSINGVQMNEWDDFHNFMDNTHPGDNLTIVTNENTFIITLTSSEENENLGYLGLVLISAISRSDFINPLFTLAAISYGIMGYPLFHPYCNDSFLPWPIVSLLTWIFLLNFAIGLFNMLPAIPLDGGYILEGIVEKRTSAKTARRVALGFSFFVLALIVVSFLPSLW